MMSSVLFCLFASVCFVNASIANVDVQGTLGSTTGIGACHSFAEKIFLNTGVYYSTQPLSPLARKSFDIPVSFGVQNNPNNSLAMSFQDDSGCDVTMVSFGSAHNPRVGDHMKCHKHLIAAKDTDVFVYRCLVNMTVLHRHITLETVVQVPGSKDIRSYKNLFGWSAIDSIEMCVDHRHHEAVVQHGHYIDQVRVDEFRANMFQLNLNDTDLVSYDQLPGDVSIEAAWMKGNGMKTMIMSVSSSGLGWAGITLGE